MKFRITPLNFATAFLLILAVYIWINGASITGSQYVHLSDAITGVFFLFAFVVAFIDLMFRNFFKATKTLWLIEVSFIALVAVIFFLVK